MYLLVAYKCPEMESSSKLVTCSIFLAYLLYYSRDKSNTPLSVSPAEYKPLKWRPCAYTDSKQLAIICSVLVPELMCEGMFRKMRKPIMENHLSWLFNASPFLHIPSHPKGDRESTGLVNDTLHTLCKFYRRADLRSAMLLFKSMRASFLYFLFCPQIQFYRKPP